MPWVKLDDGFSDHPKVEALSDAAFRLHVAGLCYAGKHTTDGRIAEYRVNRLVPRYKPKTLDELVRDGLWHRPGHDCPSDVCGPVEEGFLLIHDYLAVQRSKEQVERDRAAAASRQKSRRDSRRDNGRTNGVSHGSRSDPIHSEGSGSGSVGEPTRAALEPPDPQKYQLSDNETASVMDGIALVRSENKLSRRSA